MTQNYRNNLNKGFLNCKRQEQGICRVFFSVVYLTLALNSPVKIFSLIHANKKIHKNKAKYTIKSFLHIFT